ncbi:MAG: hypothetical protein WCI73_10385 [Phycisphaerae bacterium]
MPGPLAALRSQVGHSRGGHPMSFLGHDGLKGPWYYYPYIFAMKTHLTLALLALLGLLTAKAWRNPVALAAILLVLLSCTMKISGGPRYFLVLYMLAAMLAGLAVERALAWPWSNRSVNQDRLFKALAVGVVASASLLLTLRSWPELFTHTSPLWGGDAEGYRYADANYDWGQGLYEAFRAADRGGLQLKSVVYLSNGDPFYGIPPERGVVNLDRLDRVLPTLRGHQVAVAAGLVYSFGRQDPEFGPLYRAFNRLPPVRRLTDTFFLFDLQDDPTFESFDRIVQAERKSR